MKQVKTKETKYSKLSLTIVLFLLPIIMTTVSILVLMVAKNFNTSILVGILLEFIAILFVKFKVKYTNIKDIIVPLLCYNVYLAFMPSLLNVIFSNVSGSGFLSMLYVMYFSHFFNYISSSLPILLLVSLFIWISKIGKINIINIVSILFLLYSSFVPSITSFCRIAFSTYIISGLNFIYSFKYYGVVISVISILLVIINYNKDRINN